MHIIFRVPKEVEEGRQKKKLNNDQKFSKSDENYKLTGPRCSMNPTKHKKHEENYSKAHHSQIVKNR